MRYPTRPSLLAPLLAALLFGAALPFAAAAQGSGSEVLTNESVTQMIAGKVPKDLIVTKIRTTKSTFDITPAGLIALNAGKVPSDIIKLMMQSAGSNAREGKETLNNDAIVQMVNGQLSRDIIVTKIQMSRADYDLTTSGIISLNQSKVSQDVVKAMMTASSMTPPPAAAAKKPEPPPPAPPPAKKPPVKKPR